MFYHRYEHSHWDCISSSSHHLSELNGREALIVLPVVTPDDCVQNNKRDDHPGDKTEAKISEKFHWINPH
jgi:hypothetical protein